MELKSMLLPEKVVTFEYPDCKGLKFELAYLSKESNQKIFKKCQVKKYNKKTRQYYDELDDDKFLELYVRSIIKGWRGFKIKYLSEFLIADFTDHKDDELLDFTEDNALELMKNSVIFDQWVSDIISELENFTKRNSKEKSNLSKSISKSPEAV